MQKVIISTVALLLLGGLSVMHAQGTGRMGPPSAEEMQARIEQVAGELDLSEEQKTAFLDLGKKHIEQIQALRAEDLPREEKQERAENYRANHVEAVQTLLTPEQFAKWEKLHEQRKQHQRHRRGRGHGF